MKTLRTLVFLLFLTPFALSAQAVWTSRNPGPTPVALTALAAGNGIYVAITTTEVFSSTDSLHWQRETFPTGEHLNNVGYANNHFFIRGDSGTVFVSDDGHYWLQRLGGGAATGFGLPGHNVAYGNGTYVIVSSSYANSTLTSPDAVTFTRQPTLPGDHVVFGAGVFLLYSYGGSSFLTSTDGVTWTSFQPTGVPWVNEIAFGAGRFVARHNDELYRSDDGHTWTRIPNLRVNQIVFVKDRFIAADFTTKQPITSPDGITWTTHTGNLVTIPASQIASAGGTYVGFVGNRLYRSDDAIAWTVSGTYFSTSAQYPGVAFGHNRFLTAEGYTSTDGIAWSSDGFALPAALAATTSVRAVNDRFFLFAGGALYSSADGLTGQQVADFAFNVHGVAYGKGRYVVVGANSAGTKGSLATSADAIAWTDRSSGLDVDPLQEVAFAADLFIAVASSGAIYTSPDGLAWTPRPHAVKGTELGGLAYGAGRWVLAGRPMLTSTDGVAWHRVHGPNAHGVSFANGTFVAAVYGYNYNLNTTIATSADGLHWTFRDTTGLWATSLAYGAGSWIGTGSRGSIIQSDATNFALAPVFASGVTATVNPDTRLLTLDAPATGADALAYRWTGIYDYYRSPVPGVAISKLTVNDTSGRTIYGVSATNASGSATIFYAPVSSPTFQFTRTQPAPDRLTLEAYAYSFSEPAIESFTFEWFKDGVAIPASDAATITIPFDSTTDASSIYSVKVTNAFFSRTVDYDGQPRILSAPASQQRFATDSAVFEIAASLGLNNDATTITWTRDGTVVRTATYYGRSYQNITVTDRLSIETISSADFGVYQVTVKNGGGTVVSNPFSLTARPITRLTNLSARAMVGTGENVLIAGFVASGATGGPDVLVRGIGPALGPLGVATPLPRAHLGFNNSSGVNLVVNDHWDASPGYDAASMRDLFTRLGAFALTAGSADAALLRPGSLKVDQPPRFTAVLSGVENTTGVGLIEVYEAAASDRRLMNLSARAKVGTGEDVLIAGFVISGDRPLRVLIRGIGPSLAAQGIATPLSNPKLILYDSGGHEIHNNDQWNAARNLFDLRAVTTIIGAFALNENSNDAAMLELLDPGVYSVHVISVDGSSGVGLVEIYEAP